MIRFSPPLLILASLLLAVSSQAARLDGHEGGARLGRETPAELGNPLALALAMLPRDDLPALRDGMPPSPWSHRDFPPPTPPVSGGTDAIHLPPAVRVLEKLLEQLDDEG